MSKANKSKPAILQRGALKRRKRLLLAALNLWLIRRNGGKTQ